MSKSKHTSFDVHLLAEGDAQLMASMSAMFGAAFDDADNYSAKPPGEKYLKKLLATNSFIALAALRDERVIGGLVAYELQKFEQERSEIYIYDLAVASEARRKGVAMALIEELKSIAKQRGAYEIFVQADTDVDDEPAIALYSRLGARDDVLHFTISVDKEKGN